MCSCQCVIVDNAACDLVALDGLEQRLEITFAETVVLLALNELEESRPYHVRRKNLQQQTGFVPIGRAVHQDAACLQLVQRFTVAGKTLLEHFVVGLRRCGHELYALIGQPVPALEEIVTA